jgi:hypothetical protein
MSQVRGNPYLRGRLSTVDLLVQIECKSAVFDIANIVDFLTKYATFNEEVNHMAFPLFSIPCRSLRGPNTLV